MRRLALLTLLTALATPRLSAQIVGTVADFDYQPSSPRAGDTVTFTDRSVGSVYGWYWSFGDGGKSGDQNPSHVFANPGVYAVTLAVLDRSLQEVSVTKTVSVAPGGSSTADFTFSPVLPSIGQTVQFTDHSSGSPTAWSWSFGDGATSTQQNPTHAFSSAADFSVKLTVTTASGSGSVTKTVSVQPAGVSAAFAFFPQEPAVGDPVSFQNLSTGSPTSFHWDFGDGESATDESPTHTYQAAGSFSVTLTASAAAASDSVTQTVVVSATSSGTFSVRVIDVEEVPSETTNGNGHPEPGERIGIRLALTNGTTRTEPAVVAQLLPWTWNANPVVDMVDFGTVPAGAASAVAEGRFEVLVNAAYDCNARIGFYVRLFLAGRATDAIPFDVVLPNGSTCDAPALVTPTVTIDEPPPGTRYAIGSPVAFAFTLHGSLPTQDVLIELSRDGGATFPEVLSNGASEMTGTGPHVYPFIATGPASARVRFRVTVALGSGGTISAVSSHDLAFADAAPGATAHLPVVVQGPGRNQTFFTTDATIASPDGPSAVLLTFTPVGGQPVTTSTPISVPRGSLYLPDVFQPFREEGLVGTGAGLVGTFGVTGAANAPPVLTARVTNLRKSGIGTFGLAFASRPEGQAITEEAWVSGMVTGAAYRSNLSLAHVRGGSGNPLGLSVELWDGATGQQVPGSPRQVSLPPDGFTQINDFEGFTVSPGTLYQYRIVRIAGDDQFRAYGTVIDAVTGDPSYVEGAAPFGDRGAHLVRLASVVEASGLFGAFFTSDVTIVNRSATAPATISLHLEAQGSWDVPNAFVIGPRQVRSIPGVVAWFRQRGATLSGTVVGPLRVSFSGGDGAALVRTSSPAGPGPGAGSYGLAFAARRPEQEAQGSVMLSGARKSGPFRSNLALVHKGTGGPITLSYKVVAAVDGTTYGPATATLSPGGFFQASDVVGSLGGTPGYYDVFVTRTSGSDPWEAYMTILDNVTNDGSFVEMVPR